MAGINPFAIAQGAWQANALRSMGSGLMRTLEQWESLKYVDAAAQDIGNIMGKPEYGSFFANVGRMALANGGSAEQAGGAMTALAGRFAGAGLDMMLGSLQHEQEMERLRASQAGQMNLARQYGENVAAEQAGQKRLMELEQAARFGNQIVTNPDTGSLEVVPVGGLPEEVTTRVPGEMIEVPSPDGGTRMIEGPSQRLNVPVKTLSALPGVMQEQASAALFGGMRDTQRSVLDLRREEAGAAATQSYLKGQRENIKLQAKLDREAEAFRSQNLMNLQSMKEDLAEMRIDMESARSKASNELGRAELAVDYAKMLRARNRDASEDFIRRETQRFMDSLLEVSAQAVQTGTPAAAPTGATPGDFFLNTIGR